MKATKYEVKIVVECLSMDSVPGLVMEAMRAMQKGSEFGHEIREGQHTHDDGDFVKWSRIETPVEF